MFGDRRIDHAAVAEFFQQTLADLVGALVLRHLLAHQEHAFVAAHFLGHRIAQGFAYRHGDHFGALGNFRIGKGFGRWRLWLGRSLLWLGCGPASRFVLRFRLFRRGWRSGGFRIRTLTILQQSSDGLIDLHALSTFGHQQFSDTALVHRLEFHGGLVGFDLREDVAGVNLIAFLDEPFCEFALFHGG